MEWRGLDIERRSDHFLIVRNTQACNIGICLAAGAALVIDAGMFPRIAADIVDLVRSHLGARIELVVNTHYHSDHTFGNQVFDCPILAAAACRDRMRQCLATHWSLPEIAKAGEEDPHLAAEWKHLQITLPTETFDQSLEIDFHGMPIVCTRLGGHTPDSTVVHFPDQKLVFAGDIVFAGVYPTLLSFDCTPVELIEALGKVSGMDVDVIVPGHGMTCDKTALSPLVDYWENLLAAARALVDAGRNREQMTDDLVGRCHLPDIAFSERKHRRNAETVLSFLLGPKA
jgi:cyclase